MPTPREELEALRREQGPLSPRQELEMLRAEQGDLPRFSGITDPTSMLADQQPQSTLAQPITPGPSGIPEAPGISADLNKFFVEPPERQPHPLDVPVAFAGGVLSEASLGLADPLLEKINPDLPQIQEAHPVAAGGGRLVGFAAPFSGIAKAARAVPAIRALPAAAQEGLTFGTYEALRERDPAAFPIGFGFGVGAGGAIRGVGAAGRGIRKVATEGPLRPSEGKIGPVRRPKATEPQPEFIGEPEPRIEPRKETVPPEPTTGPGEIAATPPAAPKVKSTRDALIEQGVPRATAHKVAVKKAAKAEVPPAEPDKVGLSKRGIRELEQRHPDLKNAPQREKEAWAESYAKATELGHDKNAVEIAQDIVNTRRPPKAEELAGMVQKAEALEREIMESRVVEQRLLKEGEMSAAATESARRVDMLQQLETLRDAAVYGGSETGRTLNIIKSAIDRADDFSITTLIDDAKLAKGSGLTPGERGMLEDASARIKKLEEDLAKEQAAHRITQEQTARFEAKTQVQRIKKIQAVKHKVGQKREKLRAEREAIKKEIAALGFRLNDITGVSAEGSYLIGKLAVNYVKEGALTLEEVVRLVRADIPDLTARDVHEALQATDPTLQRKARSIVEKRVSAIKTEARLLTEIETTGQINTLRRNLGKLRGEAYQSGIEAAELEKSMRTITELQEKLAGMKKGGKKTATPEELKPIREKIGALRKELRIDKQLTDLNEQLRTGEFKLPQRRESAPLPKNLEAKQVELNRAKREVRSQIDEMRPTTLGSMASEAANTLRTAKATADMSYALRQGAILSARRPGTAVKAFGKAFKSFFSEQTAEGIDASIRAHENQYIREKAGLFLSELGGSITKREEHFMSRFLEKIPGVGAVVRASERNMTTGLNLLRTAAFDDFLRAYPNATTAEMKAWANWVNVASGRGSIKIVNKNAKALSAVVFAPKFSASRIQAPFEVARKGIGGRVRKEIAKDMAAFAGLGVTALTLADMAGLDVNLDPRSPDFAKIKVGNTRIDLWAGIQQPMRMLLRIGLVGTNRVGLTDIKNDIDPIETMYWFSRYKAAPAVNILSELGTGKAVIGGDVKPLDVPGTDVELPPFSRTIANAFVPLVIDDIWEAYQDAGLGRAALVGGSTFLGVGANTYERRKKKRPGGPKPVKPIRPRPPQPVRP